MLHLLIFLYFTLATFCTQFWPTFYWLNNMFILGSYFEQALLCITCTNISRHWHIVNSWDSLSRKTKISPFHTVSIMACWWPGDIRSQGISSHGTDFRLGKYSKSQIHASWYSHSPRVQSIVRTDPIHSALLVWWSKQCFAAGSRSSSRLCGRQRACAMAWSRCWGWSSLLHPALLLPPPSPEEN